MKLGHLPCVVICDLVPKRNQSQKVERNQTSLPPLPKCGVESAVGQGLGASRRTRWSVRIIVTCRVDLSHSGCVAWAAF
jgi:hypothetical protein